MITDQELADLAARVVAHAIRRVADDRMGLAEQLCSDAGIKTDLCQLSVPQQELVLDLFEAAIRRYLPVLPFTARAADHSG